MANYRNISLSFWTDSKVDDDFTPEDKYFYLYLLTNPHTNICGCYEISSRQMERETGYNSDTIKRLIKRMVEIHNVIRYSEETKEVLILHWDRYNWSGSKNVETAVRSVISHIKNEGFRKYILQKAEYRYNSKQYTETDTETVSVTDTVTDGGIGYKYPIDTLSIPYQNVDSAKAPTPTPEKPKKQKFVPPTLEEVQTYCKETGKLIDAEYFISYYGSQNWRKANGQPLSDWKLAVCQWWKKDGQKKPEQKQTSYDLSAIEAQSMELYKDL